MTVHTVGDTDDVEPNADPYPMFRRLRKEASLHYNEHDFYALSRFADVEPRAPHVARYVEFYGQSVPEGAVMMMLIGAAVRDHRQFPPEGDVFDIHREARQQLAFSVGTHNCLGSALAWLEGRIAIEEILKRFPEWDVDLDNAHLSSTSTVRGWESMPGVVK